MASRFNYLFNNLCGTVYRQGNLLYSPDGSSLYSAVGNRVTCFDLVRSRSFTFPFEARRNIARLAISPDGAILLAIDDEGHLLMANVLRRVVIHHLNLKQKVSDVRFSPDGRWVAFAVGRLVQVWATPALERSFTPFALHKTLGGHGDDVTSLDWSEDSLFVASGAKDMSVRVHSVHKLPGYTPGNLTGHRSTVRAVFFGKRAAAGDERTLFAVSRDGALSVWALVERPVCRGARPKSPWTAPSV
jgi:periodic tryptophan protein 2